MILRGDARQLPIADGCVHCVVTSPPYWGLRDYGATAQIGREATPKLYVASLLTVFAEIWRVLKDDGTVWLNLGDSYAANNAMTVPDGLKSKDLVGIPWRVAFALQAAGWYLRSDVIWHKPNPMPESVTDRPTKSHEYVFLLTKSEQYYYDAKAIAESSPRVGPRLFRISTKLRATAMGTVPTGNEIPGAVWIQPALRNKRSVWTIPTMRYSGAHFATMPEALIEPCILAGSPIGGLVLDPFVGSGTVGAVAERTSRRWLGVDLAYHDLSTARTAQRGLRFDAAELAHGHT